MRAALSSLKVKGAKILVRTRANQDGSVLSQITIAGMRESPDKVLLRIGRSIKPPKDTFFSTGFKFDMANVIEDPDMQETIAESYQRNRGSYQTTLYYQEALPEKVQTQILRARDVLSHMRRAGHRKPSQLVLRVNWNPKGIRPKGK